MRILAALLLALAALSASGCDWWDSLWTKVPGGCEGMDRAPDRGNSPCPPGHERRPGGNP